MKKTIFFIHGMFQNPKSWTGWVNYFESRGYHCIVPAWPYHEGEPALLRKNIPEGLGNLKLDEIITPLEAQILSLEEKPVVIGHSVGGLIAQLLLSRGIASAAVAVCSVAPNRMITFDWSFFKNVASIANPLKGNDPIPMDLETFKDAFANTLTNEQAELEFERTATPDGRNVFRSCMSDTADIDVELPHAPLLFISAEQDQICPPTLIEKQRDAYTDANSITYLKEFSGRSHYICNEPGWENVASFAEEWIVTQLDNMKSDTGARST